MLFNFIKLNPTEGAGAASGGGSPQGTGGDGTPSGGDQGGDAGGEKKGRAPGQDKTLEQLQEENKYVTPALLQGSHNALRADLKSEMKKFQNDVIKSISEDFSKRLDAGLAALKAASQPNPTHSEGGKAKESSAEVLSLKEQLEALKKANEAAQAQAKEATERERNNRFETTVKQALIDKGCIPTRVDLAYRAIAPELRWSDDGKSIVGKIVGDFDQEFEVDPSKYIEKHWRDKVAPELFLATQQRQGGPSGGEKAGGEPRWMFTKEQHDDPEFYAKNREKMRYAVEHGLVKGMPRPTQPKL